MKPSDAPHLYAVLDITPEASDEEVKKAYHRQAMRWHPDMNQEDPDASLEFRTIQDAYHTLADQDQRARYDMELMFSRFTAQKEQEGYSRESMMHEWAQFVHQKRAQKGNSESAGGAAQGERQEEENKEPRYPPAAGYSGIDDLVDPRPDPRRAVNAEVLRRYGQQMDEPPQRGRYQDVYV